MDILFSKKKKYIVAGLITVTCCLAMVIFPSVALYATQKGISLWASNVLPALLPFFICANFLTQMGVSRLIKPSLFPFAMSVLSGYPMGAKIIGDMRREKQISIKEGKRLISFCSTSGPTFMIGAVGVGLLNSTWAGIIIATSHYLGAVINGLIYSLFFKNDEYIKPGLTKIVDKGLLELFTDAIFSSFKALGIILAYVVLFMFVTDLIHLSGILSFIDSPPLKGLIKGFFEMTVGCGALSECVGISISWKCVLCTFCLSWGGLSIIGQSMSMLFGSKIPVTYFVLTKITHSIIAGILALIMASCML
ncbi:MAG: hypothetical protein RSD88_00405 [Anaerovoracaceae bacterium]